MNEDLLCECRNCDNQVSRMAEECPNCKEIYPSLSEEEIQEHYSHCISCNERLLINDYWNIPKSINKYPIGKCPKCGQPEPIRVPPVPFPPKTEEEERLEKKHKYIWWGCLLFILLIIIFVGYFYFFYEMPSTENDWGKNFQ